MVIFIFKYIICSFRDFYILSEVDRKTYWSVFLLNRPPKLDLNELISIFGACRRWKSDVNRCNNTRPDFMFTECKFDMQRWRRVPWSTQ